MAAIFLEGFDKYGPTGEANPAITTLLIQGEWTSTTYNYAVVAPLSSSGFALTMNTGGNNNVGGLLKTLSASYATAIGGIRFQVASLSGQTIMEFMDGVTAQSSITVNNTTGTISLRTGGTGNGSATFGTAIATSTVSIQANQTHYIEWKVAIGVSGAVYAIYLDGVSIISGNTGATRTTGNSSYNGILIISSLGNSNAMIIDDLYLFDTTGSTNNDVLRTNPRVETKYPSSDTQTQWTGINVLVPAGLTAGQTSVSSITANSNAPGANELVLLKVTPAVNCTLNSVALSPGTTAAGAKFKAVLYSDSAGAPNTLTTTGTEVTGVTSGTTLTLPFAVGQSLTGGTSYWIGHINDTSTTIGQFDATTNLGQKKANTYGSGAPAGPLSAMTTGQPTWLMWGVCTAPAANWVSVAQDPAGGSRTTDGAGDSSSISSSTVNNEDLYGFPVLSTTANNVYAVAVKANVKNSDTGTRTIDLRLKSNVTDSAGSTAGQSAGTSYVWLDSYFDTDPNGPTAWTASGVNAAKAGPKIAS